MGWRVFVYGVGGFRVLECQTCKKRSLAKSPFQYKLQRPTTYDLRTYQRQTQRERERGRGGLWVTRGTMFVDFELTGFSHGRSLQIWEFFRYILLKVITSLWFIFSLFILAYNCIAYILFFLSLIAWWHVYSTLISFFRNYIKRDFVFTDDCVGNLSFSNHSRLFIRFLIEILHKFMVEFHYMVI